MPIPTISQPQVASLLKPRASDSHKGLYGSVLVIGGDNGMVGATLLEGRAALKMGAGCVHVGLLAPEAPSVDHVQPELMLHHIDKTLPVVSGVLALGCGLGVSPRAQRLLHDALWLDAPLVLDADALNLLAAHADLATLLRERTAATVLTPHPGEAARLLACRSAGIQSDRPAAARRLAAMFRCTVVLKGANSLITNPDGALWQNTTGNPGMSAPGMGDVLAGMIAAFIAQGVSATDAAKLAAHLHGAAGDVLAERGIKLGMTASELTDIARELLNNWQSETTK